MEVILAATAAVSLSCNVFLFLQYKKLKKSPPKQETYDATALLHDLTAGRALVRIERIAPADVFLRSPRGNV